MFLKGEPENRKSRDARCDMRSCAVSTDGNIQHFSGVNSTVIVYSQFSSKLTF